MVRIQVNVFWSGPIQNQSTMEANKRYHMFKFYLRFARVCNPIIQTKLEQTHCCSYVYLKVKCNAFWQRLSRIWGRGGGVLPYITYTGMWFWSSWFRTGYTFRRRFLERGIIFRAHESSSFVSSHLKLFKDSLGCQFGGPGGTYPPKKYPWASPPPPGLSYIVLQQLPANQAKSFKLL